MLQLLLFVLCLSSAAGVSVVVSNGYEFHAALTSPQVTWILVADNVSAWQFLQQLCRAAANSSTETASCSLIGWIQVFV